MEKETRGGTKIFGFFFRNMPTAAGSGRGDESSAAGVSGESDRAPLFFEAAL